MAAAPIAINPAVFVESYQSDPFAEVDWEGYNSRSNETHAMDKAAAFEFSEEVITLRLAAGVTRWTKDCVFEFHCWLRVAGPFFSTLFMFRIGGSMWRIPRAEDCVGAGGIAFCRGDLSGGDGLMASQSVG